MSDELVYIEDLELSDAELMNVQNDEVTQEELLEQELNYSDTYLDLVTMYS